MNTALALLSLRGTILPTSTARLARAAVVCCFIGCGGDDGPADGESTSAAESESSSGTPSESTSAAESESSETSTTDAGAESSTSTDDSSDSTGDAPSIPAACEAFGLPAEQGQETVAGHFTTVAEFEVAGLQSWLGEVPAADQAILVLATHPEYDCNRVLVDPDLNHSYGYSRQLVYVFPGPIAAGEYTVGVDVRAWSEYWLGDGGGNGGAGSGELDAGTLTIVTADAACVTGTQDIEGGPAYGFAVSTDAACM